MSVGSTAGWSSRRRSWPGFESWGRESTIAGRLASVADLGKRGTSGSS